MVRLPTKTESHQLGSTHLSAERRIHAIERRWEQDPEVKVQYHNFMKEYEDLGHIESVKSQKGRHNCYFLPHHQVFKETNTKTKTRVVFHGGAKTSNGLSLNDIFQVGHIYQQDLYSIVLRFRTHQVCFIADIGNMYVHPEDRALDIAIHFTSNHPYSHKMAGFYFYINRINHIIGSKQTIKQEWDKIINMA